MNAIFNRQYRFLLKPLNLTSRLLLLAGAACVVASVFFPLWRMHLTAPQYAEGLQLDIYAWKLEGGGLHGNDLNEINNLNHYIGMKPLQESDFTEMQVIPFMLGLFVLLSFRAAALGGMRQVIDLFMLAAWFGVFSIGTFYYRLYTYGHDLDPKAPMTVEPFTPVLIGKQTIANFSQASYPHLGTWLLWVFMALLLAAVWCSRKEEPLVPR
ncbi:MAG: hypothetical protein WD342_14480 [Verrucomicrobiales bacterium]